MSAGKALKPETIAIIRKKYAEGIPIRSLSSLFSTHPSTISRILRGVAKKQCLVTFCQRSCQTLPDDAEVSRASQFAICFTCRKTFLEHETFAYKSGLGHVYKICDGRFVHL